MNIPRSHLAVMHATRQGLCSQLPVKSLTAGSSAKTLYETKPVELDVAAVVKYMRNGVFFPILHLPRSPIRHRNADTAKSVNRPTLMPGEYIYVLFHNNVYLTINKFDTHLYSPTCRQSLPTSGYLNY